MPFLRAFFRSALRIKGDCYFLTGVVGNAPYNFLDATKHPQPKVSTLGWKRLTPREVGFNKGKSQNNIYQAGYVLSLQNSACGSG